MVEGISDSQFSQAQSLASQKGIRVTRTGTQISVSLPTGESKAFGTYSEFETYVNALDPTSWKHNPTQGAKSL